MLCMPSIVLRVVIISDKWVLLGAIVAEEYDMNVWMLGESCENKTKQKLPSKNVMTG